MYTASVKYILFKEDLANKRRVKMTLKQAIKQCRQFNKEYSQGRTDDELVKSLLDGAVYTNFGKIYAVIKEVINKGAL